MKTTNAEKSSVRFADLAALKGMCGGPFSRWTPAREIMPSTIIAFDDVFGARLTLLPPEGSTLAERVAGRVVEPILLLAIVREHMGENFVILGNYARVVKLDNCVFPVVTHCGEKVRIRQRLVVVDGTDDEMGLTFIFEVVNESDQLVAKGDISICYSDQPV